ncbi:oxidoreductase [Dehalobacter sp. DCM]|uniref:4Fe-4S dicluster domain-containing protein n=1 Tax=Dehalobacter sp. DCM TaxID=2907827 RepID=UPI0030816722|nr:oxidoreductase [Dehalobacter sp. DCM]
MSANKIGFGLLINYEFCTGCHVCEIACKKELDLPVGQWGIKVLQDGPRKMANGKWEYNFLPMPTSLCDLCAERIKMGKKPTCVHHCQAGIMTYGPLEELVQKMTENPKTVLFAPR